MFKNWFRNKRKQKESNVSDKQVLEKGDKILVAGDSNYFYKITRNISDKVSSELEASTIPLWIGQLYMHYWDGTTPVHPINA